MIYKDKLDYIRDLFAKETSLLTNIRNSTKDKNDQISIFPEEGKLLQLLIQLAGVRKIVEIGTLAGYSTNWMADALPMEGKIYTLEMDTLRADKAKNNLHNPKIELIIGDAQKTLPTLNDKAPFDMVFIDADKLNYLNYLDWAEKHVRQGGLIIGDNTLLFDAVWQDKDIGRVRPTALKAMREFNQRLTDPKKYTSILLPTAEGITIAIKNF